jgi:S1-C subfamily serine protease
MKSQKIIIAIVLCIIVVGGIISSGAIGVNWNTLESSLKQVTLPINLFSLQAPEASDSLFKEHTTVTNEESVIINAVEKVKPSVVTIGVTQTGRNLNNIFDINPLDPFGGMQRREGNSEPIEQDIGSGFVITEDGLIVTNKHVVSDVDMPYKVITSDDKTYKVEKIYRDPSNDVAILKINATGLTPIELGDSDSIRVGQLAIAMGTALGEFRQTVTTGVISGVGRGITAGSPFEGSVERLDNVIQTDAAINPGNSGGPLLNSAGLVIGVNTAVSAEGQNIGFAIPINIVKDAVTNFNTTGQFNRPFLGVRYRVVTRDIALLNELPEGAYILEVVEESPAKQVGIQEGDIITHIDDQRLSGDNAELAPVLQTKKVGDTITITIWRDGEEQKFNLTLSSQE